MPLGLVLLAQAGHYEDGIHQDFLVLFASRLGGSPLYVTVLAVAAFYAYAAMRRVPGALDALTAAVALLTVVGPTTLTLEEIGSPQPLPLLAASFLQLGLGFWQRQGWRYLLGAGAATMIALDFVGAKQAGELVLLALLLGGARVDPTLGRCAVALAPLRLWDTASR